MAFGKKKNKKAPSRKRRFAARLGLALSVLVVLWGLAGEWYVHHTRAWLELKRTSDAVFLHGALAGFGGYLADVTDALGWTGHDAVYEYDTPAPAGQVLFAGAPQRVDAPAPEDITVIDRGEFKIGWSPSLRHPVWCAYHVTAEQRFDEGKRPSFLIDKTTPNVPRPDDYTHSGFDRGHMVPNYAMITRYGEAVRRRTFLMSNIAPQSAALNRGVWRDVEHRIADLWTARYGEIWVVVGGIPSSTGEKISGSSVDVPEAFYQIILAQEGLEIRALALLFSRDPGWSAWAAQNIVSIDDIEALTGLDFNPDLPAFIQDPLEAETPGRLWPIRLRDLYKLFVLRFMH